MFLIRLELAALFAIASFVALFAGSRRCDAQRMVELNVGTLYVSPDQPPQRPGYVLIFDGKIESTVPGATAIGGIVEHIDCPTCTVTAGFWNVHVHFIEQKWTDAAHQPAASLQASLDDMLLSRGFTTIADLASNPPDTMPLRRRIESGELKGPRVYTAGRALFPPRPGLPFYLSDLPRNLLDQMQQPSTPAEAREDVEKNFAGGSDLLKLFTGSIVAKGTVKPMPLDIARAAVGVAHQRHKLVFAHPSNLEGATIALESGVDVLAHAPSYPQGIDRAFLQRVVDHHMAMVPTLKMFSTTVRSTDDYMLPIVNEVRSFHELGGELLFGTDVGYMHDYSTDEEFRRLVQAGLSANDILRMLTLAPAARFGVSGHTGTIAAGKDGDLTILDADPAQDSMNFARVRCTIRQGQVIWGNCKPEEHRKLKR